MREKVSALGCRCTCALFSFSQHLHFTLGEPHMSRRHFVHWTDNWHRARWPCSYWEIFILFSFPGCQILLLRQTCSYLHKHKASFSICVSQHQLVTYKAPVHLGSIYFIIFSGNNIHSFICFINLFPNSESQWEYNTEHHVHELWCEWFSFVLFLHISDGLNSSLIFFKTSILNIFRWFNKAGEILVSASIANVIWVSQVLF